MPARPTFLRFHRRVALLFAPLLLLQALTGCALLFRADLSRLAAPEPVERTSAAGHVPLSAMLASATVSQSGYRAVRVFLPATEGDTAFVHLTSVDGGTTRYAAVDPGNGRVLASGSIWRFPAEAALQLHYRLVSGRTGMVIVLLNGAALMMLSISGLLYWWPGRPRLAKGLAIRSSAPPRLRLRQWHRSIGVILTPLMLFSGATGILLILPDLAASASPAAPAALAPAPTSPDEIDSAFERAKAALPGAQVRDIRFPAADRIDVNFHAPRHNSQAVDMLSVRISDGTELKRLPAGENPALWMKILPLHSGTAMGLAGLVILLVEGLALMALAMTGPVMWWQARRSKQGRI
jgi:uncharacterized iron-regulated membrane protein